MVAEQAAQRLIVASSGRMTCLSTAWTGSFLRRRSPIFLQVKKSKICKFRFNYKDIERLDSNQSTGGQSNLGGTLLHPIHERKKSVVMAAELSNLWKIYLAGWISLPVNCKYCLLEVVSHRSRGSDSRNQHPTEALTWSEWETGQCTHACSGHLWHTGISPAATALPWDKAAEHAPQPPPRNSSDHHGYSV